MINSISTCDYELQIDQDISDIYKIRNGRLWAILKNRKLLFSDLNTKPKPLIKIFDKLNKCEDLFVSPDGEFCLIRTNVEHYHILVKDLEPQISPIMPGTKVLCAAFNNLGKYPKPIIFMGTDGGNITYFNLNNDITSTSLLPIILNPATPIDGISIVLFPNGDLRLSIITANKIIPKKLSPDDFLEIEISNPIIPQIPKVRPNQICCENNLVGILTNMMAFEFIVKPDNVNPRQLFYVTPENACGFVVFEEFMLLFCKNGDINVYLNNSENAIETFNIKGATKFEYDSDQGELYAVSPRKISKARPNFYSHILSFIARKFISSRNEEEAISMILKMKFTSFHEMLQYVGHDFSLRLCLFKRILEKMRTVDKSITPQKAAIAHSTLLYYIQLEVEKETPNVKGFSEFALSLIKDGLIDSKVVTNALVYYGWDEPIPYITDPLHIFNIFMQQGETEIAVEQLPRILNDNDFFKAALRVFNHQEEKTIAALSKRSNLLCNKVIPILMKNCSSNFVLSLLQSDKLSNVWINRIFCLFLAEKPTEDLVNKFFIEYRYSSNYEIQFLIRSMLASHQYLRLSTGLMKIMDYDNATLVASKGDPSFAFDLIAQISDPEERKFCATRILRSLTLSNESGKIARKLLEKFDKCGIEASLLMQFLPKDTPSSDLSNVIKDFTTKNVELSKEQQSKIDESLSGCDKAEKLIKGIEEKAATLASTTLCEKCRKSLFTEPGIVYPCSHILHQKCAQDLVNYIQLEPDEKPIDYSIDCPICGFLSVRLIDQPFKTPGVSIERDPWSIDQGRLMSIAIQRRRSTGFIAKLDK
ncbi:hypothetical protein TRFO_27143 [Tritrichomonas foetus]|uniref:RING-type domain-containing protein n=1 Tax=Tritrichomonas foetus TaxID=1144522 RepID=A0A1J4K688_9EUKA|nr:hypothetical protein TRFO_27143 [Tritrichomonas foetus]|eukprot:OHT05206.1 hypothetical protein TRFO_27143 [Tritrichomonas foetus]